MAKTKVFTREDEIKDDPIQNEEDSSQKVKSGSSTQKNLPPGWTRTTMVIRNDHLKKLKDLAWWERTSQSQVFAEILEKFFSTRKVPERPKETKILSDE